MMPTTYSSPWYAIRVKANAEWKAAQNLEGRGIEVFLPVQRRQTKRSRRNVVEVPLFPGYLFARFEPSSTLLVVTCPGIVHILCRGNKPEPVDPVEMHALRAISRTGFEIEALPAFAVGQKVRLSLGPLAGVEAIVLRDDGHPRLIVSITLLRRSVIAEVDRAWLEDLVVPVADAALAHTRSGFSRGVL